MPKVFISYRRSDTQMVAGRLHAELARRIGDDAIFRDKNSIAAGEDWTKAIEEGLTGEVVVLALIGPSWATARDEAGRLRLEDPADWNRVELEKALERRGRVIPLLVDETKMLKEAELPEKLRPLARSNALKLRDDDWDSDIEKVVRAVGMPGTWNRARRPALAAAVVAVIAAGGTGYWWLGNQDDVDQSLISHSATGSTYRVDIREKLRQEQEQALQLLDTDKARAIRLIDENLAAIGVALKSFPDDAYLHALAGYAAKNVYASSKGLLTPESRNQYLANARKSFERVLALEPENPGAVNGMGNVLFYERRFDDAIKHHEQALSLAEKKRYKYSDAAHDLALVRRVKSGEIPFDP